MSNHTTSAVNPDGERVQAMSRCLKNQTATNSSTSCETSSVKEKDPEARDPEARLATIAAKEDISLGNALSQKAKARKADGFKRRKVRERDGPRMDFGENPTTAGRKDTQPNGVPNPKEREKVRAK